VSNIIAAAEITNADAHPGFSENSYFQKYVRTQMIY
jgi:hypothetical protein